MEEVDFPGGLFHPFLPCSTDFLLLLHWKHVREKILLFQSDWVFTSYIGNLSFFFPILRHLP